MRRQIAVATIARPSAAAITAARVCSQGSTASAAPLVTSVVQDAGADGSRSRRAPAISARPRTPTSAAMPATPSGNTVNAWNRIGDASTAAAQANQAAPASAVTSRTSRHNSAAPHAEPISSAAMTPA